MMRLSAFQLPEAETLRTSRIRFFSSASADRSSFPAEARSRCRDLRSPAVPEDSPAAVPASFPKAPSVLSAAFRERSMERRSVFISRRQDFSYSVFMEPIVDRTLSTSPRSRVRQAAVLLRASAEADAASCRSCLSAFCSAMEASIRPSIRAITRWETAARSGSARSTAFRSDRNAS